jgi:ADP-heptose:LPS heptosyltransferase
LVHLGTQVKDFADSAAIVSQLDLLIGVDTAAVHLAGALGVPCWVMLPREGTDWRWLHERADSPWYPTLRLFRQGAQESWAEVVERVAQALADLAQDGGSG